MSDEKIEIKRIGKNFVLTANQRIEQPIERVFELFSDATQLENITPPYLNFKIITPLPIEIRKGTKIDYRLKLHGIPIRWRSLIAEWDPNRYFVDEQLKGPYRYWRHEHFFEATDGATIIKDVVNYRVPFGTIVNKLFVQGSVQKIFAYRQEALLNLFSEE